MPVALFVALMVGCGGSNPPDDASTPDVPTPDAPTFDAPTFDAPEIADTAPVSDVTVDRGDDAVTVDAPAPLDVADVTAVPDVVDVPVTPDVPAPDVGLDVPAPDVPACATGYADCDGNAANGCETNTSSSSSHCGACGRSCPAFVRATPVCVTGACDFRCLPGYDDCNGNAGDGCEISLGSTANCGACGVACARANAAATCTTGTCALGACATGFGNCDGVEANGCETAVATPANCGACGVVCARANATVTCATGACALGTCAPVFGNCDGNDSNGC
ncbi:MAG: uncharacterized protein JWM10_1906 [Myxococcaceae bacterium]|nr:uncharacterized protein [Myxococcaceae bacterium]